MHSRRERPDLKPFYLLLVGVGGIAAHLASEFAAMGADARAVLFSPRHWYLGIAAVAGIILFVARGRQLVAGSSNGRDLKRMLYLGLESLPLRGRGVAFFALTAALQFAVGMSTEFGEGAPIAGHDVAGGVLGALLVVLVMAFAAKAIARKFPTIVAALVWMLVASGATATPSTAAVRRSTPPARMPAWTPSLLNRPPPSLQSA